MKPFAYAIVLLYALKFQTAFADSTLHFIQLLPEKNKTSQSYQIKAPLLRLSDSHSKRINLFNSKTNEFISIDTESKNISKLNEKVLTQRLLQLNQKRHQHIREVETKMQKEMQRMSKKEQEIAASLLNQLKYPDLYGGHTLLELTPSMESKTIQEIPCTVYKLYRNALHLKSFCIATATDLKLKRAEYQTLRSFYQFDYSTQSRIMLASGKGDFELISFDKNKVPGIIIEQIHYRKGKITSHLILNKIEHQPLQQDLFKTDSLHNMPATTKAPAKP